jgi:hypothetical protein
VRALAEIEGGSDERLDIDAEVPVELVRRARVAELIHTQRAFRPARRRPRPFDWRRRLVAP